MITQTKLLTYDDYRTLPDDGNQYELIGGELLMSPSPSSYHQIISSNLFKILESHVSERNLGRVLYAPLDVVLSMRDVVQPDLMYVSSDRADIIAENNVVEVPDLVIEILSEATKTSDQVRKKNLYETYGAGEYWIVDPGEKTIDQFILQGEAFRLSGTFGSSQQLTSPVIDGLTLPVGQVFVNR